MDQDQDRPLNPSLYAALARCFGDVKISNPGVPAAISYGINPANGRRTEDIRDNGEYYRINCPFCGDTRHRLYLNHRYGTEDHTTYLAICYDDIACLSGESAIAQSNRMRLEMMLTGGLSRSGRGRFSLDASAAKPVEHVVPKLPGVTVSLAELPARHPARIYLDERGFDPAALTQNYGVVYCTQADRDCTVAEHRIIIPCYVRGQLLGWQARYVGDVDWKATGIQKYYNMRGMSRNRMLYNYDRAVRGRIMVVAEGVTNVWRVGSAGVASYGNTMSSLQQELIGQWWSRYEDRPVALAIAYDNDRPPDDPAKRRRFDEAAAKRRLVFDRLAGMLAKREGVLSYVSLPVKRDLADCTREEAWGLIYRSIEATGRDPGEFLD